MILRIYNTVTGLFLRDDFTFEPETESAYEGDIPGGLYLPRFILSQDAQDDGGEWIEGLTVEEIKALQDAQEPAGATLEERVTAHGEQIVSLEQTFDAVFGG